MINAAVIENDVVTNVIYIDQANIDLFAVDGMELIDSAPLGLTMGDYRDGDVWYRGGQALPIAPENHESEIDDMRAALEVLEVYIDG